MTDYYVCFDTGSDGAGDGLSWANADKTTKYALENRPANGDRIFVRRGSSGASTTADAYTGATTILTIAGTDSDPVSVIGCIAGTTNEPPVKADYSDRVTDNNPAMTSTVEFVFTGGDVTHIFGVDLDAVDDTRIGTSDTWMHFENLKFLNDAASSAGSISVVLNPGAMTFVNCEVTGYTVGVLSASYFSMMGGELTTGASWSLSNKAHGLLLDGVYVHGSSNLFSANGTTTRSQLKNCRVQSGVSVANTNPMTTTGNQPSMHERAYIELIGCDANTGAKASDFSYQNYDYEEVCGSITNEATAVRTGGADDGASGQFSIAMTPNANNSINGTKAVLVSQWIGIWIPGGSSTLTVYTTHDNDSSLNRDLYESELFLEFMTPDSGDTAQNQFENSTGLGYLDQAGTVASGVADTSNTWPASPAALRTYARKHSISITPGFTGWARVRVCVAHDSATPVTVYVDPKIEVT